MSVAEFFRPKLGKCPRMGFKKKCDPDCELYVEVPKIFDTGETIIFKGCVDRLSYIELINQTQRISMMQSEIGESKNAAIYQSLALLGSKTAEGDLLKLTERHLHVKNVRKIPSSTD